MIRKAAEPDLPYLVLLGEEFHAAARVGDHVPFDLPSAAALMLRLIRDEDGVLLALDDGGDVVGMAGAILYHHPFNGSVTSAQELFWYVRPGRRDGAGRALLSALEDACRRAGASLMTMISVETQRPDAVAAIYRRAGYAQTERTFMKRL